jgi:hypothetical protein
MWATAGAGFLLILLISAALVLPRILDTEAIGRNLASELEARYHIRSQRIKISFLPLPRIVMYGVKTTIPETLSASADAVSLHLKILPLLTGRFEPAEIEFLGPMITEKLPEPATPESGAKSLSQRVAVLKERVSQLQALLSAAMPGVVIDARNGGLELYLGQNRAFFFEEIDLKSSVNGQRVDFELTSGKSNLWQALTFNGQIDLGTLKGSGELNLTGGNPGELMRCLNTPASDRVGNSQIDLNLTLSTSGPKSARVDFTVSVPQFTFEGEPQNAPLPSLEKAANPQNPSLSPQPPPEKGGDRQGIAMSNGTLSGALTIDTNGVDFSISQFRFDNPRVNLTASYVERYSDQSVTLNIDGRETDVATVRNIFLTIDKENRAMRRTFEIIREGEIPEILFRSRAKNPSDLKKYENYTLRGSLENGTVFAPKVDLLVSNVYGDVVVEKGVLSATHVSGKTAVGSSTQNGELKIGLPREDHLFHMDLPIAADLSELPDVLRRVAKTQDFKQQMAQIKDVTGKTQGRLVLGENMKALNVKVECGPFQLHGRYGRLPEPIDLEGASFKLEGSKLSATSLTGKSGSSSLDQADLSWDWGEAKVVDISSKARSVVSMDLLNPYLRSRECWKNLLDAAPKGLLVFRSLRFTGPNASHSKWVLNASGQVEDILFQNKQFNGPLILKTGAFEIDGDQLTLRDINAVISDSSLLISGGVAGFLDQVKKLDLQMSGRLGPEGNKIAASIAGFPPVLKPISNLDLRNCRLTWDRESKTTFKGEIRLSDGSAITVSLVKTPLELSIEDLVIKDEDSNATISMISKQDHLEIEFSGTLSNKTADRFLVDNRLLTGPIEGKFRGRFFPDAPDKSSAQGEVKITGFRLPVTLPIPAKIESAVLEADGNQLNVKSAMISWNGSRLSLTGSISITGDAYLVDMNAFADSLDLESILQKMEDGKRKEEVPPVPSSTPSDLSAGLDPSGNDLGRSGRQSPKSPWEAPFRGTIRVRSEYLSYKKITWNPADAEVILNPGSIDIRLNQANLCGISTPGLITVSPKGLNITMNLSAKDQNVESALACLFNKKHMLTGSYTLTANIAAKGGNGNLADSLEGDVELKAKDGRILRFDTLAKIISLLAVSEIYRGVVPDLIGEGCAYTSIETKGKIKNGKLVLSDSVVAGPCIKVVFRGEIDLAKQKVDVTALVAPLRTVERVVDATPLMGKVLNEAFVTLPVRISGNLADPAVVLLSPSAVGEELFGVMKRVFKLPLSIFQPLVENDSIHNADSSKQKN